MICAKEKQRAIKKLDFTLFSSVPGAIRTRGVPLRRRTLYPTEVRRRIKFFETRQHADIPPEFPSSAFELPWGGRSLPVVHKNLFFFFFFFPFFPSLVRSSLRKILKPLFKSLLFGGGFLFLLTPSFLLFTLFFFPPFGLDAPPSFFFFSPLVFFKNVFGGVVLSPGWGGVLFKI